MILMALQSKEMTPCVWGEFISGKTSS